jgi:hypothetical protein
VMGSLVLNIRASGNTFNSMDYEMKSTRIFRGQLASGDKNIFGLKR